MPALSKFLVLLALFLLASHVHAFTSLSSVAGDQVRVNHLIRLQQLMSKPTTEPKAESKSREPEINRKPRAKRREPRAERREPRAKSRTPRTESRKLRAESQEGAPFPRRSLNPKLEPKAKKEKATPAKAKKVPAPKSAVPTVKAKK